MRKAMALMALTILTACDYAVRNDIRGERDDRAYRAAMDDYRAGRMDAAVTGLEKAVRNDPSNASARFQLACLQQDLKKDFLSAYCGYREFLLQQPDCDRAKLARERLSVCEKEAVRSLLAKYGLDNASDVQTRELAVVRAELKEANARISELEKDVATSRKNARTLSAERDRLRAAIRGDVPEDFDDGGLKAALSEKDLLEEDQEDETTEDLLAEARKDETSTGSSLLPIRKPEKEAKPERRHQEPAAAEKKENADRPKTYVVEDGDTLYGVAKRFYGSIQAWKAIREANKALISSDNRLRAGDTIVLP